MQRNFIILFGLVSCLSFFKCDSLYSHREIKAQYNKFNRNLNRVVLKKRQENLCPVEYESCWCDYTNTNSNEHTNKFNSKSTSFSIMIDCQFYINNDLESENTINSKLNRTNEQNKKNNHNKKILTEIPKIASSNTGSKFKYLNHITHLDLSRTAITEVSTDAFQGLNGLETVVITNCKNLVKIKMFAFRNLPNLKTLIISNNPKLIELEPHAFGSLRNLNYLSLSMNQLNVIDGYIFSASTSIKIIDFIGNPIQRIKSHAFHGLRNVSDLLLSLKQNVSPIEHIEGDSFISTAFVDQIFLEGIPARILGTNAFRGLSHCKNLYLANTFIEEIEVNAFYRANNIQLLNLINSRIKNIHSEAFRGIFNVEKIDLRGNYLTKVNRQTFETLVTFNPSNQHTNIINESIIHIDNEKNNKFIVKKILFEQNPIQCDCNLVWILENKFYSNSITLPEICAGPKGYDCLRTNDLSIDQLPCSNNSSSNQQNAKVPCDDLVFDVDKNDDIYSVSISKGKKKFNDGGYREIDEDEAENYDDNSNYQYDEYDEIGVSTKIINSNIETTTLEITNQNKKKGFITSQIKHSTSTIHPSKKKSKTEEQNKITTSSSVNAPNSKERDNLADSQKSSDINNDENINNSGYLSKFNLSYSNGDLFKKFFRIKVFIFHYVIFIIFCNFFAFIY